MLSSVNRMGGGVYFMFQHGLYYSKIRIHSNKMAAVVLEFVSGNRGNTVGQVHEKGTFLEIVVVAGSGTVMVLGQLQLFRPCIPSSSTMGGTSIHAVGELEVGFVTAHRLYGGAALHQGLLERLGHAAVPVEVVRDEGELGDRGLALRLAACRCVLRSCASRSCKRRCRTWSDVGSQRGTRRALIAIGKKGSIFSAVYIIPPTFSERMFFFNILYQ